jgi:hypothetical protein
MRDIIKLKDGQVLQLDKELNKLEYDTSALDGLSIVDAKNKIINAILYYLNMYDSSSEPWRYYLEIPFSSFNLNIYSLTIDFIKSMKRNGIDCYAYGGLYSYTGKYQYKITIYANIHPVYRGFINAIRNRLDRKEDYEVIL